MTTFKSLCEVFGIEYNGEPEGWEEFEYIPLEGSQYWAFDLVGNQNAKGNHIDRDIVERQREHKKKRRWFNDGKVEKHCITHPPGFVKGRLPKPHMKSRQSGEYNSRAQEWRLTFCDGSTIMVTGLKAWCKLQPDINYNGLYYAWQQHKPYKMIQEIIKP